MFCIGFLLKTSNGLEWNTRLDRRMKNAGNLSEGASTINQPYYTPG